MSGTRADALLVLSDGAEFEGEAIGALDLSGATTGEGRVQHRAVGLPGDRDRPVVRGAGHHFTYPHIGNYGVNDTDDESRRPFCAGVVVRDLARRQATGAPPRRSTTCSSATASRGSRASTPGASPATCATTARSGCVRHRRRCRARRRPRRRAPPTASTWSPVLHRPAYMVNVDDSRFSVVAYDFGIKRTMLANLLAHGARSTSCPPTRPRPRCWPAIPTACSSPTGPATPRPSPTPPTTCAALLGNVPLFGICLGHQILGRALGLDTYKLRFGHHGANHPVRHEASAGSRSPARTTTTRCRPTPSTAATAASSSPT
jgi:carbamoyl-phosphate synthase small subunit